LIEAEPLPSEPPKGPAGKHSTMTGVGPVSLEVRSKDLMPEELQQLDTAARTQEAQQLADSIHAKASDPLAATVRAATSPFPPEALGGSNRPAPNSVEVERTAPVDEPIAAPANPRTVSQVPPAANNIEPEPEMQIPEKGSTRWLWISVFGLAAGVLSFLAVPMIRNMIAPGAAPVTPRMTQATASAPAPVETAVSSAPAVEAVAASESSAPPAPSAAAPASAEPTAPALAAAPSVSGTPLPTTPPASGDEPDESALASLEKGTGFLYVVSPLQTNVYVYGILAGQTNQRLVSKCGPRFIRLGTTPGAWQSQGSVSIVKCGGFTRVQMTP
jgi:hypothetical protein